MKKIIFALAALAMMTNANAIVNGTRVKSKTTIAMGTVSVFNDVVGTYCTGTLIDPHWVLTAAHCLVKDWKTLTGKIKASNVSVIFGEFDATSGGSSSYTAKFIIQHPGFLGATTVKTPDRHDIALIRIDSKLPKSAKPIPVLSETDFHGMTQGTEVILAGYGMTSTNDHSNNKRLFSFATTFQSTDAEGKVARLVPYANRPGGNCPGDSGGPAFLNVQGQLYVWGVASTAEVSCVKFGEYGNITHYADWVRETMANNPAK